MYDLINWVSEWLLLNANAVICQLNFQWVDDEVRFVLDLHAELDFYSASSLKQQSIDMSLHSDTLFWHRANQSLPFLLNAACLVGKQQIPFFCLWFDPIYHIRGEHTDHYATDAVFEPVDIFSIPCKDFDIINSNKVIHYSFVNFLRIFEGSIS